MDIQKLKYFYEIAKCQHVTKAAESLHIAQPALTQAMKALEKELEVNLYTKSGRNIVLTDAGEYLKKRLDTLLPEFYSLEDEMRAVREQANKTIKLNILAASNFVIDTIVMYRTKHPDVIFEFEQNIYKKNSDIIVSTNGIEEVPFRQYSKRCVKEEKIYLAVPARSKYANREAVELAALKDENFVMLSSSRLFGAVCNKLCSVAGFVPKILFESDSPTAVQNIVSTGAGIAFWPEYSWGTVNNHEVKLLEISNPICQREIIVELYDRVPQSAYAEDFYEFLLTRYNG